MTGNSNRGATGVGAKNQAAINEAVEQWYTLLSQAFQERKTGTFRLMIKVDRGRVADTQVDIGIKGDVPKFASGQSAK